MSVIATFEVYGLSFILQRLADRTGNTPEFKLVDEAFSAPPVRFSAASKGDLLHKVERYIGGPLPCDERSAITQAMGKFASQPSRVDAPLMRLAMPARVVQIPFDAQPLP